MKKIKIGLIGVGGMGGIHFKLLQAHPQVELVGACDIDPKVQTKIRETEAIRVYSDYKALIDTEKPEAVIIATPPHLHPEQALYALDRGLYVLLEKPMAVDVSAAKQVYAAANGRLMMAFSLRFHGLFQRVRSYLNELGPLAFQWQIALGRMPRNSWVEFKRKSGGMVNENAVHALYVFLWYAGAVKEVSAQLRRLGQDREIEDTAVVKLVHENGATSMLLQTWAAQHRLRNWGLQAERGTVTVDGYLGGPYKISQSEMEIIEEGEFKEPVEEMYSRQLNHFVECVLGNQRPLITEEDGLHIQRVVEAIHLSAAEQRPVRLSEVP